MDVSLHAYAIFSLDYPVYAVLIGCQHFLIINDKKRNESFNFEEKKNLREIAGVKEIDRPKAKRV